MTAVLDVRGLRKSYGGRMLFDGVDFSVSEGEKVGVIGRNGSGKSTLFSILAGLEGYEEGTLALRRGIRVGFLAQNPEFDRGRTIYETAAEGIRSRPGEWDARHRAEAMLTRLGVEDWDRTIGRLSGGERRRVGLARTLLSEPGLLLLDEPTNHLDADTVLWLEETLFDFNGALLVVTHDRYFLDRVVDRMLEVSGGELSSFEGGYTEYLEARAGRESRREAEEAKRRKLIEKELAWARRSPPARTGKQKARRRRAHEMSAAQRERDRARAGEVTIELEDAPRLGSRVLELHDVSISYADQVVVDELSDRLLAGERIGVVGPNGSGKSTLLRALAGGPQPPTARIDGRVVLGENTRVGYFDQEREIDPRLTVERAVSESDWVEVGGGRIHLRAYLDRFLFPDEVRQQRVGSLSGGERNRVLLARLFLQDFNLLLLDEPTNDLDLDTLRILEDALEDFGGCVLVVTHDRYLLDKLATSLWIFEGAGSVRRHHGTWDAYLARRESERSRTETARRDRERDERAVRAEKGRRQAREARSDQKRLSYNEQRELGGMEDRIAALESERDEMAALLGDPAFYQESAERIASVTERFKELESELESLYARWMELAERA